MLKSSAVNKGYSFAYLNGVDSVLKFGPCSEVLGGIVVYHAFGAVFGIDFKVALFIQCPPCVGAAFSAPVAAENTLIMNIEAVEMRRIFSYGKTYWIIKNGFIGASSIVGGAVNYLKNFFVLVINRYAKLMRYRVSGGNNRFAVFTVGSVDIIDFHGSGSVNRSQADTAVKSVKLQISPS